ncbi:hypothetical protein DL89DRAFT_74005 [Linderina pennispora]|uniref:Uncharacterized protein n=1 Tax=Linderina pennispora TaxID=61395 RepID=A0A1Y1VR24_9FUNG|nr:uncharacterized protein DL89DRAFT_74005 [Linderina pennispora]ORX63633.1 hypothetical protein DL89DRAFT_74005 [Linderina pennispora]
MHIEHSSPHMRHGNRHSVWRTQKPPVFERTGRFILGIVRRVLCGRGGQRGWRRSICHSLLCLRLVRKLQYPLLWLRDRPTHALQWRCLAHHPGHGGSRWLWRWWHHLWRHRSHWWAEARWPMLCDQRRLDSLHHSARRRAACCAAAAGGQAAPAS